MSKFDAASYLSKFGWSDSKGLGKNEDGRTAIVRATKKDDNSGIGSREDWSTGDKFTSLLNNSLKSIEIVIHDEEIPKKKKEKKEMVVQTSAVTELQLKYGNFQKSALMLHESTIKVDNVNEEEAPKKKKSKGINADRVKGKLARVTKQEASFMITKETKLDDKTSKKKRKLEDD